MKLAFKRGMQIKQSDYSGTLTGPRITKWLSRFNNVSNVQVGEKGEVTFEATKFAAEGIARESGFDVYSHGGDSYSLNVRQKRTGATMVQERKGTGYGRGETSAAGEFWDKSDDGRKDRKKRFNKAQRAGAKKHVSAQMRGEANVFTNEQREFLNGLVA